jgi:hypothetical protein
MKMEWARKSVGKVLGETGGALFGVVIVHDEDRVDHARNVTQECQDEAQKQASDAARQHDRDRRKNEAEEKTERFHKECRRLFPGGFRL